MIPRILRRKETREGTRHTSQAISSYYLDKYKLRDGSDDSAWTEEEGDEGGNE